MSPVCRQLWYKRDAQTRGGGGGWGGVMQVAKTFVRLCAQNYSGAQFIASIQDLILITSPDPGTAGYWEEIYMDHAGVQPLDRNFYPAIDTTKYVWNGFLDFFRHELTQILEYK